MTDKEKAAILAAFNDWICKVSTGVIPTPCRFEKDVTENFINTYKPKDTSKEELKKLIIMVYGFIGCIDYYDHLKKKEKRKRGKHEKQRKSFTEPLQDHRRPTRTNRNI